MNNQAVKESKHHGLTDFPYSIYHVLMPEHISEYALHFHEDIELLYVIKGKIEFTILGNTVIANEGEIALLLPNIPHAMKQVKDIKAEYCCLLFNLSILKRDDSDTIYNRIVPPIINHDVIFPFVLKRELNITKKLSPICTELLGYWSKSYDSCAYAVLGNLYRIVGILWDFKETNTSLELSNHKNYLRIREAIYAVQNRYEQELTVEEMANLCNISSSHFMKLFKDVTGDSFNNFLINYRLQMAEKRIKESDDKIVNISTDCGFNNPSYFARAFTKRYHMSPLQYRNTKS